MKKEANCSQGPIITVKGHGQVLEVSAVALLSAGALGSPVL